MDFCCAFILVSMRCGYSCSDAVRLWCGCSCLYVVRLFLFRFDAVVLISIQCGCSCFDAVRLFLWLMMMSFALGGLLNQAAVQKHYEACISLLMLVRATSLRYLLGNWPKTFHPRNSRSYWIHENVREYGYNGKF
jgi:hypothetical protein